MDTEDIKNKFNIIIDNYKQFSNNVKNMDTDIKKLTNVHENYIKKDASKYNDNYGVYVDDIQFQIQILTIEHESLLKINNLLINKCYRDLFKLYNKIIKILISVYKDNKETILKIFKNKDDSHSSNTDVLRKIKIKLRDIVSQLKTKNIEDDKVILEIKKKYYENLKIYNDIDEKKNYSYDDINNIFDKINSKLEELSLSCELIKIHIVDIKSKIDKGIMGQSYLINLDGKYDRIMVDYLILKNILNSIISMHLDLSNNFKNKSNSIAEEVVYDEDETEEASKDGLNNLTIKISELKNENIKNIIKDIEIKDNDTNNESENNELKF
jgi:hypothetical protein